MGSKYTHKTPWLPRHVVLVEGEKHEKSVDVLSLYWVRGTVPFGRPAPNCQWQSKNADLWQLNFVGFWLWKCHKKTGLLNIFFKECINNLLLLFHEFFTFLQTVTFSLDINDCTVMKYPIQNSRSNSNVCKHFIPLRKGLI